MSASFQVRMVAQSMKDKIAAKLVERLKALPSLATVEFDRVRLRSDDFMGVDCPAVQLIDVAERVEHEARRAKKTWSLALELVMRSSENQSVSQRDLWNLQYEVERVLWTQPNLGIPGMIHLRYMGSQTDLHLLDPYFFVRLDLEALYYEPLVSEA